MIDEEEYPSEEEMIKYVSEHGWIKEDGYRIDVDEIKQCDYNVMFVDHVGLKDYVVECEYWSHPDEEMGFEELEDVYDYLKGCEEGA